MAPDSLLGWNFAGTILVSAFLLFQVQPLIAKFILPWFGGCPAVWTTCMLFFQILLFGGYLYAHLSQRWLSPRNQAMVQLLLVVAALAVMPIAPTTSWKPVDSSAPTWRVLMLLVATVGLPYFVLSATSPLVQTWYSLSYPGRSPYRLYALSNVGSLAALLTYPFFFEPALDVVKQSTLWSALFVLYTAFCGMCLLCLWRLGQPGLRPESSVGPAADPPGNRSGPPTWLHRLLWLALPACASLMLLATTNHVCQDIAVIPMLWVVPLALYLLTFIICFDHERWYIRGVWAMAAALGVVAVAGNEAFDWFGYSLSFVQELVLYFSAMFFMCMVCHGELVRLRPDPRYLTEFYLLIAAGGAVGGISVSLIAPLIFTSFFEWKIGLVASYGIAVAALAVAATGGRLRLAMSAVLVPTAVVGLWYILDWETEKQTSVDRARNFYGVVSVLEYDRDDPAKHEFMLMHGRIPHGRQFAAPDKRRLPTAYYSNESGVGRAIRYFHARGTVRVGVVGLGVGTLAAYAGPGDEYRFYEINPEVLHMARKYFTYLDDCRGTWDVVLGDARLSLESEPQQKFQLLVLDAFSGDAIPAHLLTREAFEIYQRQMAPDCVIAVHITNRYLQLAPVVRGLAEYCGLNTRRLFSEGCESQLTYDNDWMLLTRNEDFLRAVSSAPPPEAADDFTVPLWTDSYSNLFQILQSGEGRL